MSATLCFAESGFTISSTLFVGQSPDAKDVLRRALESVAESPSISSQSAVAWLREKAQAFLSESLAERTPVELDSSAMFHAIRFASMLPGELPRPDVAIEPDGDIAFDWIFGQKHRFVASVTRDGTINYAGVYGLGRSHGTEVLQDSIPALLWDSLVRALQEAPARR